MPERKDIHRLPVLEAIRSRKSVRRFLKRPVEEYKIRLLLEAAQRAPSSNNTQPWHFIVLRDEEVIRKIARVSFSGLRPSKSWLLSAPVIIVVCARPNPVFHTLGGRLLRKDYHEVDVAIATEHIVLEAVELGLGTCWFGMFAPRMVRRILKVPRGYRIIALLPLGYPAEDRKKRPLSRRKPIKDIASYEIFGGAESTNRDPLPTTNE